LPREERSSLFSVRAGGVGEDEDELEAGLEVVEAVYEGCVRHAWRAAWRSGVGESERRERSAASAGEVC
jgi:hypothetical protein